MVLYSLPRSLSLFPPIPSFSIPKVDRRIDSRVAIAEAALETSLWEEKEASPLTLCSVAFCLLLSVESIRMAQQADAPNFGNWGSAQSVPYTQYFDQARGKQAGKTSTKPSDRSEHPEAHAKDVAPPLIAAPHNPETTKPKDAKPMTKDVGNFGRTDMPPFRNEGATRKSPANPRYQQKMDQANYGDNHKRSNRNHGGNHGKPVDRAANNPPPSDKRIASESTPGRNRANPSDRNYGTPLNDVAVPPFAGWDENDPASGEKYTGIFKLIADNRRTPGTPYKAPQPSDQKHKSAEPKGCGCLSWMLK